MKNGDATEQLLYQGGEMPEERKPEESLCTEKWSARLQVRSPWTAKFFRHSSLRKLAIIMNFVHVPTQSWFGPIIVNCGRMSLIVIICNVADSFDCVHCTFTFRPSVGSYI